MKHHLLKKIVIAICVCIGCLCSPMTLAQPTMENVTLFPAEPWAQSTITFNVTITNEIPTNVYLIVRECNENFCYSDSFNESMDLIGSNTYQATITLKHNDTILIDYLVNIQSDETWNKTDFMTVNLSEKPSDGTNGTNGNGNHQNGDNNGSQTPGFEFLFVFLGITIIYMITRKRYQ